MNPVPTPFDTLAPHWRAVAADGLAAADLAPSGPARLLSGGVSGAPVCMVPTDQGRVLLRLEPERIALEHRARNAACMRAAAEAGVAPPVLYSDPVAGVTVMAFIEGRPLSEHPGGRAAVVRGLGGLVAQVQAVPPFPMLGGGEDVVAWLLRQLAASGVFAPGLLDRPAEALARVRAVRPWDLASLVPSHNDPNPRNLISDGRRLWLIDWELACQNDPLFDLAIISTDLADTPALRDGLIEGYFGRAPTEADHAALDVVRLLARLFYGCIVMESLAHGPGRAPETSLAALTPEGFGAEIAAGRLGGHIPAETARAFGLMSLRAFVDGVEAFS